MPGKEPACPICRADSKVAWLLNKNDYSLYRCADCNHIFVDPLPTQEQLAWLYSFKSGYQQQAMLRFEEMDHFPPKFTQSLEQLSRHVSSGKLLDLGSSVGYLLYLARRDGFDVQGVELNPDTAAIAQANGLPVFVGPLENATFPPATFDAVHLGDVIEHVTDPEHVLRQVHRLVKPQGVILVVTPNHDALFARATYWLTRWGIPWSHPTPPFHLNQFSVASLTKLLHRSGFKVIEERFTACSLGYELRSTGTFKPLKESLQSRRWWRTAGRAVVCTYVSLAYSAIWLLDRLAVLKRYDCTMRLVATPRVS